jgi:hypothetical protein
VPRTQSAKKPAIQFCGDCGYQLAPDSDGKCPMCPRFQQIRTHVPPARNRAAELVGSSPTVPSHGAVIRNRTLRGNLPPNARRVRPILPIRDLASRPWAGRTWLWPAAVVALVALFVIGALVGAAIPTFPSFLR